MSASSEFARIAKLAQALGAAGEGIVRGIGDDAAVLEAGGGQLVWTVDAQVEGVHFRADLASCQDVGWRSFMAAASDLAAMGASPWCALSSLILPRAFGDDALDALAAGQAEAARAVGAPVVGGNLARGDAVSITTTLLGRCAHAIERSAEEGDGIWIAGPVGLAAAGLAALERKLEGDEDLREAIEAWRRPRARIADGLAMAKVAHGAIDVSDGLAQDLAHVAWGGSLRARIDEAALLAHGGDALARAAARLRAPAIGLALHGGEDYAIVCASAQPIPGFTRIGTFDEGSGVALVTARGVEPVPPRGYDHFR